MMFPTLTALEYPTVDHFLLDGTDVLSTAIPSLDDLPSFAHPSEPYTS
jgi:hypothetical protein